MVPRFFSVSIIKSMSKDNNLNIIVIDWSLNSQEISLLLSNAEYALDSYPYPGVATAYDYLMHNLPIINDVDSINTSFPNFISILKNLGAKIN